MEIRVQDQGRVDEIRRAHEAVRAEARFRNRYQVALVTDSIEELGETPFRRHLERRSTRLLGCCGWGEGGRHVWIKPGCNVRTVIHEFAHAFTADREGHDRSFRYLYVRGLVRFLGLDRRAASNEAWAIVTRYTKQGLYEDRWQLDARRKTEVAKILDGLFEPSPSNLVQVPAPI